MKTFIWAGFLLFFMFYSISKAAVWKGIVPLKSTRTDVEKNLKVTNSDNDMLATYDLENEKVIVQYSYGLCSESVNSKWNVPKNTVVSFIIYSKKQVFLSELSINLSLFEKRQMSADLPKFYNYRHKQDGISYSVDEAQFEQGSIASISYFPKLSEEDLKCSTK